MSEIHVIYHDVPNNYGAPEFTETLGYCLIREDAIKVVKELKKQRHPEFAIIPYSPVYPGKVYCRPLKEMKPKGKKQ